MADAPYGFVNITAKFIGADGSMGFKNGQIYDLWMMKKPKVIYISRQDMNATAIPYGSMKAVKKNWEMLNTDTRWKVYELQEQEKNRIELVQPLLQLSDEELAVAVMYATYYLKYGEDVTKKLETATQNARMIYEAEKRGYAQCMDDMRKKEGEHE